MLDEQIVQQNGAATEQSAKHRPIIIADGKCVKENFGLLRHIFFGLAAAETNAMLVVSGKVGVDLNFLQGVEIVDCPALKLPFVRKHNYTRLIERLKKFNPTVIHCFGIKMTRLARTIATDLDLPCIVSLQDMFGCKKTIRKADGFDAIIVPGQSAADMVMQIRPRISHLVNVVPIGTFVDESCACFDEPGRLASMILVDELDSMKRFEPLLCALRHLAVDGYEFLMVLMGDGKARRDIVDFIRGVGLGLKINVTNEIRPLRNVLQGADVYVQLRSAGDHSPALIEAASAGLAVAACKSDMGKFLKVGQTALFFDSADELTIYSTLQKLLDDRMLARNIAGSIQDYLRTNNTVSDMVEAMVDVYEKCKK